MSENLNEQVVVGFFADVDAADGAADALMNWDKVNEEIKLGAIGCLTLDDDGKIDAKRYGSGRTTKGALIGGAIGLVTAGITGGLSLLAGTLAGGAVGGISGKLTAGSFGLTDANAEKIKAHLADGGAAVVVLCDDDEIEPTIEHLEGSGGDAQSFGVSSKVLEAIHQSQVDKMRDDEYLDSLESGNIV